MLRKIAGWLVLVPLCVVLIGLALANRHLVRLNINPFAIDPALDAPGTGIPLFLVLYVVLLVGVLLGGIAAWLAQGRQRREARHWRREAGQLTRELDALRRQQVETRPRSTEIDDLLDIR